MNRIDNMLKTNIDDYYLNLIKKYDAVISGGNILNTLVSPSQTEINDFDIYVSDKYLKLFIMDVNKHERYNIDKKKIKFRLVTIIILLQI